MNSLLSHTMGTPTSLSPANLSFLQQHVHQTTGIVLDTNKEYLLEARIAPLLTELQLKSVDHLCDALRREPSGQLSRRMVDAITTNETLFFRDFATFEALRKEVLPELLSKASGRKLRVWSAAASSGQEAYSIAMTLLEMGIAPNHVEILATDISEEVLTKARSGKYVQFEVNRGLPTAMLTKYFERSGLEWQLKPEVCRMVTFKQADLRRLQVRDQYDLLLCRNVLIYFDQKTKQQILCNLQTSLQSHGLLVLGCAETLIQVNVPLRRRVVGGVAFYMK